MGTVPAGRESAGTGGTRALLALVIGMAVLIVAGVTTLIATLVHRALAPVGTRQTLAPATAGPSVSPVATSLREPAGTRIASVSSWNDRLVLLLVGGGLPDRVVLLDPADRDRLVGSIRLSEDDGSVHAPPIAR